ncbi:MarR family winged helix-turn-helix transcriptional regulator [Paenibacillus sp. NFR01]|uniref:MarR family winged helix-turn-helix transcriptional regulator n=1 Tax=Paenibacillus sp. NFR01 TaxID=1566279 RepID=UPI0008B6735D|nr:MarR family transcriptional regulator [Paenibacillus sp. NFR01]SEU09300.1 DNA-binding transcriptional regulator, MarR family [Paenibacillus sp. NFR01]
MNPIEELRYLILAAQREGSRTFTELLKPLGLTTSQSEVLRVLYDHEPLSLIELGQLLVCETGSPSRLVGRMVEAGLIEQKPSAVDSRKVQLSLTEEGRDKALKVRDIENRFYDELTPMLEGQPVQNLMQLLWMQVKGKPTGNALALRKSKRGEE